MRINLIPSIEYINNNELKGKTVILIDVLRATSVITTALYNGALEIVPKIEIKEALEAKRENCLLGGERKALKIDGFDLTNSPLDYKESIIKGKTIIMTTTNGTKAIHHSLKADKIYIGCMLNGKAIAEGVCEDKRDVSVVCAGTAGKFSLDDFICAGKIIYECMALGEHELEDFAATAYMAYRDNKARVMDYVSMASHYKYLISIGLEEDIKYCFTEDVINLVPQVVTTNGEIVIR
jgi:2-phosphosulfolactate phosphatase